ncbi:methyl-accepting chemotaxis protein [Corallococcus exiguus]|uniref:Methyl-accepting chemotaxis protein n=2 Tax=Corallococcus exiguus TaxID=83462 RepID=A0A7X4YCM0_9BACT|nr:methyl-accepting chemotaxis protein [Corallococcus exiguus]NBC41902.1 methyl-accepting chemotaxis protein [Corallococcus exiguus]TNV53158.1 HAMP domain-containing protein [Corallococcus exiguus]
MMAPLEVRALGRWTTRPRIPGSCLGVAIAFLHIHLSHTLPETGRTPLTWLMLGALVLFISVGYARDTRALRTLFALGEGRQPATSEHLLVAVQEVAAIPGRSFWFVMQGWLGGTLTVALAFPTLADVPWTEGVRVMVLGLSIGPLSAMLTYLMVVRRARATLDRLVSLGPAPLEVLAALPPRRMHIRRRLVVFTAIAVLSPSLFILDVAFTRTVTVVDAWTQATTPEARMEVMARAREGGGPPLGLIAGIVTLLILGTAALAGTALSEPLRAITEDATRIARGEVRPPRVIHAEDEVWATSAAFTQMQVQLVQALSQLKRAGIQISSTTEQLVATSTEQEVGADEQAGALNATSATTEELARSAQQIADNAESVSTIAETTFGAAQSGQRGATAFLGAMQRMKEDNEAIAEAVVRLNKRVQQIGKVVEFINEIADKSDLLALNAELEGTKAGEVGRGFSLVAAEMRRLAENVIRSTKEIEGLIGEIRDATNGAVMATEAGLKTTELGTLLAAQVDDSLSLILELARQTSHAVRSISLATLQQQTGTDQLAAAMGDILRVTEQNAAATKQMVAANADLSALAADLQHVVRRFHVEPTGGESTGASGGAPGVTGGG